MKRLVSGIIGTQEMFELEDRLVTSRQFDSEEALAMAKHRQKRIGQLSLTEPTKGFRYAVGGLWIPHSQTENMAVVRHPDKFIHQSAQLVKDKVFEKYTDEAGEYTVGVGRLAIWAQFAENNQRRALAMKFHGWQEDANKKRAAMNPGLSFSGNVLRRDVETQPAIMGGIAAYLADLKSYVGHPDMQRGFNQRGWLQENHTKKQAAHFEWSQQFMRTQPDWEFDRWFGEAWYNHRSRAKFWHDVIQSSARMHEDVIVQRRINAYKNEMRARGYVID